MKAALSPAHHVETIATKIDASHGTRITAKRIANDCEDNPATWGRAPTSIAAAALYVAAKLCGEHLTQQEIADAAGLSRETIRDNYPAIEEHVEGMDSIDAASVEVPSQ